MLGVGDGGIEIDFLRNACTIIDALDGVGENTDGASLFSLRDIGTGSCKCRGLETRESVKLDSVFGLWRWVVQEGRGYAGSQAGPRPIWLHYPFINQTPPLTPSQNWGRLW